MARRVSKADILMGKDKVTYKEFEEYDIELPIRPLTDAQWQDIQAILQSGTTIESKAPNQKFDKEGKVKDISYDDIKDLLSIKVDTEESSKASNRANVMICHYGLGKQTGEWTVDEIENIKYIGLVEKIAQAILELTGVDKKDDDFLRPFRTE